eukprot:jgi/Tetstr1/440961/TSEL_029229.t1
MNLPAPGDAHWRVQHDAIADAFRDHCVHDLGIAVRREVDDLFQQAVPLGNTVPRDELKDLVPDAELSLPAFNVVTGSYDPRSLKSTLLEFKTMRYGVKYTSVPRATAVDRFERSLLGDIQRGLAARDAAWHNTEPGQKGPLRDILDMSEYTGMVFGTVGEVSKGVHRTRMAGNVVHGRLGPSFLVGILADGEKLQLAYLDALTVAHDDGAVEFDPAWYFEPDEGDGCCKQGGPGVGRPNRLPPRPWQESPEDGRREEKRRRPHFDSLWYQRYIVAPPRGPAGGLMPSLAWDESRFKFWTPYPMFSWLLHESRKAGMFPDETVRKGGQKPAPLGLKIAAALRFLALGVPVSGLEDSSHMSPKTLAGFFFGEDIQKGEAQTSIGGSNLSMVLLWRKE